MNDFGVLDRVDPSWRCPVCGGRELIIQNDRESAAMCEACGLPVSLSGMIQGGRITPIPAYNDRIVEKKHREWILE